MEDLRKIISIDYFFRKENYSNIRESLTWKKKVLNILNIIFIENEHRNGILLLYCK